MKCKHKARSQKTFLVEKDDLASYFTQSLSAELRLHRQERQNVFNRHAKKTPLETSQPS